MTDLYFHTAGGENGGPLFNGNLVTLAGIDDHGRPYEVTGQVLAHVTDEEAARHHHRCAVAEGEYCTCPEIAVELEMLR